MSYDLKVVNIHKRTEQIAASCDATKQFHTFEYFRNTPQNLPFIHIPVGLPVYRMANFRTTRQQKTILRDKKLQDDFFENGEENESAQREQHEILWKLAQKGQGTSIIPVSRVLEEEGQTLPLLIQRSGVVVNGNRRLAAMREFSLADDRFQYVKCIVLPPDATEDEIVDVELSLQMAPETKLPYGWVNDALAVESLQKKRMKADQIRSKMHMSEAAYDEQLGALEAARAFLKEYVGEDEHYELVEDMEQIFKNGYRAIKNKKKTSEKEVIRAVLFNIANQNKEFGARAYDFITPFERNAPTVLELIRADLAEELAEYSPPSSEGGDGALVPATIGSSRSGADDDYNRLAAFLLNKDNAERVHFTIKESVEQFRDGLTKTGDADRERLRRAKKNLANVTLLNPSPESLAAIPGLLDDITASVSRLRQKFEELRPAQKD